MDIVFVTGLRANTVIGVYEPERHIRQDLLIDLELGCDTRRAGSTDEVADALDYASISRRTLEFVEHSSFQLIESVAEHLATLLLEEFPVRQVRIKIRKPNAVKGAEDVGVLIERKR
jgi:dihydroneopterin aldolase